MGEALPPPVASLAKVKWRGRGISVE
ncbi:uncharacterized protein G2W53_006404 [Senna tora]|uniref:Uncharacterized protein n=1 Tax=Senna tora TaxID=362788 RepID=A0A834X3Y1_9FABA|nr:uncharacterized protein G2W53_006404 [Senna tora]